LGQEVQELLVERNGKSPTEKKLAKAGELVNEASRVCINQTVTIRDAILETIRGVNTPMFTKLVRSTKNLTKRIKVFIARMAISSLLDIDLFTLEKDHLQVGWEEKIKNLFVRVFGAGSGMNDKLWGRKIAEVKWRNVVRGYCDSFPCSQGSDEWFKLKLIGVSEAKAATHREEDAESTKICQNRLQQIDTCKIELKFFKKGYTETREIERPLCCLATSNDCPSRYNCRYEHVRFKNTSADLGNFCMARLCGHPCAAQDGERVSHTSHLQDVPG
jgi:hypothetical protein